MLLSTLREQVCKANRALPQYGLVTWTSGNVSGRDPDETARRLHDRDKRYEGAQGRRHGQRRSQKVWLAMQAGQVELLPAEEIAANFDRYQNRYGTASASAAG